MALRRKLVAGCWLVAEVWGEWGVGAWSWRAGKICKFDEESNTKKEKEEGDTEKKTTNNWKNTWGSREQKALVGFCGCCCGCCGCCGCCCVKTWEREREREKKNAIKRHRLVEGPIFCGFLLFCLSTSNRRGNPVSRCVSVCVCVCVCFATLRISRIRKQNTVLVPSFSFTFPCASVFVIVCVCFRSRKLGNRTEFRPPSHDGFQNKNPVTLPSLMDKSGRGQCRQGTVATNSTRVCVRCVGCVARRQKFPATTKLPTNKKKRKKKQIAKPGKTR